MQTSVLARWSWVVASAATLFAANEVEGQICQVDSDCQSGYRCAVSSGVSCSPCAVARDAGPLVLGNAGVVWPFDPSCDGGCTPYEWRYCTRASCSTDADCPSDMLCHAEVYSDCNAGCKPGFDCPEDGGFTCSERTERLCTERYNLPCAAEGACGEGFDCNLDPYTSCWGSGGVVPGPDGGLVFIDGGSGCETITPDAGWCNLMDLPCQSDSECPDGLSCQTGYSYPPCVFFPGDGGSLAFDGGVAFPDKDDGGTGYYCPPPEPRSACRPERWAVDGGAAIGGGFGGLFGGGLFGGGLTGGFGGLVGGGTFAGGVLAGGGFAGGTLGGSGADAGVVIVADAGTAPPTFGGALSGGAGGGGPGGAGSSDAGVDDEDDEHGASKHGWRKLLRALFAGGGCSLAREPVQGNLAWFSLLSGLLVLRARRRRS